MEKYNPIRFIFAICSLSLFVIGCAPGTETVQEQKSKLNRFALSPSTVGPIQISGDRHGFVDAGTGQPFFWMGEQNWQLFTNFNLSEASQYFANRAAKGFTVVQSEAALWGTCDTPNVEGQLPFLNGNPATPNPTYFRMVGDILSIAEQNHIVVALFAAEAYCVTGTKIINTSNGYAYGRYLGQTFAGRKNVIWILGGDQDPVGYEDVFQQIASGIRQGEVDRGGIRHLMSYHTGWPKSTTNFAGIQSFIDFNMMQTGPSLSLLYSMVTNDYFNTNKPTGVGEGAYEAHVYQYGDYLTPTALDIRRQAYLSYLGGGYHTYGHRDIMVKNYQGNWASAMEAPGAYSMSILKNTLLSRNFSQYIPDQSVLLSGRGSGATTNAAVVARDGSGIIIYISSPSTINVDLARITQGTSVKVSYINPAAGSNNSEIVLGTFAKGAQSFSTPNGLTDTVLFIDATNVAPAPNPNPTPNPTPVPTPIPSPTGSFKTTLKAENSGKCVDASTNTADGVLLKQFTCSGATNQNFIFTDKGGGYYEIRIESSNKCIDHQNSNTADGAALVQATCTGQANQLFRLEDKGGGKQKIHSKVNDKCIDISGISSADGAQVFLWTCWSGLNENFFMNTTSTAPQPTPQPNPQPNPPPQPQPQPIPAGSFKTTLKAENSGKCVDASTNTADGVLLKQFTCSGATNQNFIFTDKGGGYYEIRIESSNKCIDHQNSNTADGAALVQATCTGQANQLFRLEDKGGGKQKIHSKVNDKCIDISGISSADGAQVFLWTCWSGLNENFFMNTTSTAPQPTPQPNPQPMPAPTSLTTYQASTDFNTGRGFSYLTSKGEAMTYYSSWGVMKAASETYLFVARDFMHPGNVADAILRFTSPGNGKLSITGRVYDTDNSCGGTGPATGVTVTVKQNTTVLLQNNVINGDKTGFSINLNVNVVAGDKIDFIVNSRGDWACDSTFMDPKIVYSP